MNSVSKQMPSDLYNETLRRFRKLQALVNKTEANFALIKSRAITKEEANEFFSNALQMYNYTADIESSFFDFWRELSNAQIESAIRFSEEDAGCVSSLLTQIH